MRSRRWFGVVFLLTGCGDNNPGGPSGTAGLTFVSRPPAADTVDAEPLQGLVVELRDATGQPRVGVTVRFTALPVGGATQQPSMLVSAAESGSFGPFAAGTTNTRGRVVAVVRFGPVAGPGLIEVTAPEVGQADTVRFTVQPGGAAEIQLGPLDTTVATGQTFSVRGMVLDRYRNPRLDAVTYQAAANPTGAGTVTAAGQFSASGPFGAVKVFGSFGQARDSISISVVPVGSFAAFDGAIQAMVLMNFDGSNRRRLSTTPVSSSELEPAWNPAGTELAFTYLDGIGLMQLDGTVSRLYQTQPPGLGQAYWPTYSPTGPFLYFSGSDLLEGGLRIWRMGHDGTGLTRVTTGSFDARPSVAPNGLALCYHALDNQARVVVRVVEIATGRALGLDLPGLFPEWSPRGDLIAFVAADPSELKVMAPDGTGVRTLAPGRRHQHQPLSWSPDGEWILLQGDLGLEMVRVATGLVLPLGSTAGLRWPAWRPGTQ